MSLKICVTGLEKSYPEVFRKVLEFLFHKLSLHYMSVCCETFNLKSILCVNCDKPSFTTVVW